MKPSESIIKPRQPKSKGWTKGPPVPAYVSMGYLVGSTLLLTIYFPPPTNAGDGPNKPNQETTPPAAMDTPPTPDQALDELRRQYPGAFPADPDAIHPLALNTHQRLAGAGHDPAAVAAALRAYTATPAYLRAVADGRSRVDLDGEPAGPVHPAHQDTARARLAYPDLAFSSTRAARRALERGGRVEPPPPSGPKVLEPLVLRARGDIGVKLVVNRRTWGAHAQSLDAQGAKTVSLLFEGGGRLWRAEVPAKTLRAAQQAFQEARAPAVVVTGGAEGDTLRAPGLKVVERGGGSGGSARQRERDPTPAPVGPMKANAEISARIVIDPEDCRTLFLDLDTLGAKSVPCVFDTAGREWRATLNPRSFRKAQAAYREAANPSVVVTGAAVGDTLKAAGVKVVDRAGKEAKPAATTKPRPAPAPVVAATPPPPAPAVKPRAPAPVPVADIPPSPPPAPTDSAPGGRAKLSLKPKPRT